MHAIEKNKTKKNTEINAGRRPSEHNHRCGTVCGYQAHAALISTFCPIINVAASSLMSRRRTGANTTHSVTPRVTHTHTHTHSGNILMLAQQPAFKTSPLLFLAFIFFCL